MICLPHGCRRNSGLEGPGKLDNYDDELSQYTLEWGSVFASISLAVSPDFRAFFFPYACVLLYTQILLLQH